MCLSLQEATTVSSVQLTDCVGPSETTQTPLSPPDKGQGQYKDVAGSYDGSYDGSNSNVGPSIGPSIGPAPICAWGFEPSFLSLKITVGETMVLLSLLRKAPL